MKTVTWIGWNRKALVLWLFVFLAACGVSFLTQQWWIPSAAMLALSLRVPVRTKHIEHEVTHDD